MNSYHFFISSSQANSQVSPLVPSSNRRPSPHSRPSLSPPSSSIFVTHHRPSLSFPAAPSSSSSRFCGRHSQSVTQQPSKMFRMITGRSFIADITFVALVCCQHHHHHCHLLMLSPLVAVRPSFLAVVCCPCLLSLFVLSQILIKVGKDYRPQNL